MDASKGLRVFAVAVFPFAVAAGCSSTSTTTFGNSCSSICAGVSACGSTDCAGQCGSLQQACGQSGHGSDFQTWLDCSPHFACNGGRLTATNCTNETLALLACGGVSFDGGSPADGGSGGMDSGSGTGTCANVCASAPACGGPTCTSECGMIQQLCASAGHSDDFNAWVACGPTFACNSNSLTETNCKPQQQAILADCLSTPGMDGGNGDSGPTDDTVCIQNPSTCVACCQNRHKTGTNVFISAVQGCECGAGGACQTQCATTYCATPPSQPAVGSTCDTCLQTTLSTGGSCYNQVDSACNASADCVAYLNCTNQTDATGTQCQ
jgi:hypothetical protein